MTTKYHLDKMSGKEVIITGGLGFVGSSLAHRLVELEAKVTLYDALLEPYGGNLANIKDIEDKVKVVIKDIRDKKTIEEEMKDKDLVFHCAGQVSHVDSMSDPYLDVDINCNGTISLLEAMRKSNSNPKIVYAGTRAQIGKLVKDPINEDHPDNPLDIYGANKLASENYIFVYHNAYGIPAVSMRMTNCYGPYAQMKHGKYGILNWFIRLAMEDKEITVYEPGTQTREYNYIDDAADALILAGQKDIANGKKYLVGSSEEIPFVDLVQLVVKITGSGKVTMIPWPKDRASIETGNFHLDIRKIKKELGWSPTIGLEEGLRKTIEFYKQNKNDYF
ncbi:MAG: NAD-dependent epimerase/dehydratase family protein [Candidatus Ranarchaeia archaeon]